MNAEVEMNAGMHEKIVYFAAILTNTQLDITKRNTYLKSHYSFHIAMNTSNYRASYYVFYDFCLTSEGGNFRQ